MISFRIPDTVTFMGSIINSLDITKDSSFARDIYRNTDLLIL